MLLRTLDLTKTGSIDELKREVSKKAGQEREERWILGRGWDDEKLHERRSPDKHDLDAVTSNPVFLKRVCGHVGVANSKALALAGVTENSPDPDGGIIERDPDGQPNGILKEHAIELIENIVPQSTEENQRAIGLAARQLAKMGITSLHCIVSDAKELVALRRAKRDGQIPQTVYAIVPLSLVDQLTALGMTTEAEGNGFRIGGVKLFLDGSLGARTAALRSPYSDDPTNRGILTMEKSELRAAARKAKAGFQLCIHAIGDRAVELAIEILSDEFGAEGCRRLRHRIEHASIVDRNLISKMGKLGIIASVQPRFIYSDSWAGKRLGSERTHHLYPFASFRRSGVLVTAGSDCPVEDPHPFEGLWSATERPGLEIGQRMTVAQGLEAYTANAAYASFGENSRGSLAPGMIADLVVVDRDPFESDLSGLRKTRVLQTMFSGRFFF